MTIFCIVSGIKYWSKNAIFHTLSTQQIRGKLANIFALFSQPSHIPGLSDGVNRFCKTSYVYSQPTRVTDGQTDRRTCDLNSRAFSM